MDDPTDTKPFPCRLARLGWVAGVIAIVLIVLTPEGSARVPGELIAFVFIGVGIVASIVSLATIPKFGTQNILWPALAGIAVNGLLLAIAIPNFLHARQRAVQQTDQWEQAIGTSHQTGRVEAAQQKGQETNKTDGWQQYRIAGLEISSPIELTKVDAAASLQRAQAQMNLSAEQKAAAQENIKQTEAYRGQLAGFSVSLTRRTLPPNQSVEVESAVGQIIQAMQQKFPEGFQSSRHDLVVDGIRATQLSMQCQIQGGTAKVETIILVSPPSFWQIQTSGPADMSRYGETVERIFGSIKFLPADSKPAP